MAATVGDDPAPQNLLRITRWLYSSEPGVPRHNVRRAVNMNPIKKWGDLTKDKKYQVVLAALLLAFKGVAAKKRRLRRQRHQQWS